MERANLIHGYTMEEMYGKIFYQANRSFLWAKTFA